MYKIYKKNINSFREISKFCKKSSVLEEILGLLSGSLPGDLGGFTCMPRFYKVI